MINDTTSLMVVPFNRLELTKKMLASLFQHTDSPFRLIVVDNHSTDGTREFFETDQWLKDQIWGNRYCCGIDLQLNDENKGIAIGRNQCLKLANKYQDPYLCTLDNDIEFVPNWLSKCLDILSANPKFAVGINYEKEKYPLFKRNDKLFQLKHHGNLGTALSVFPRKLHEEIGFFIMEYGLYSCDDSDFFYRARRKGYEMAYLPEMGIHLGEGENDQGEYREFKDRAHKEISVRFRRSCMEYNAGIRPLYIPFQ